MIITLLASLAIVYAIGSPIVNAVDDYMKHDNK